MNIVKKDGRYTKTFLDYMRARYQEFNKSTIDSIYGAYSSPSWSKVTAYHNIKSKYNPTQFRIIAHSVSYFTAAYTCKMHGFEWFCVDTGKNLYIIPVECL